MSANSSQKPTSEGMLFMLAIALVLTVCLPVFLLKSGEGGLDDLAAALKPERLYKMLVGPEQILCYFCFTWGIMILCSKWLEVRRQRRAFQLQLLPTEEGRRILPEDARPLARTVEQRSHQGGPYILGNMIKLALSKYAVSRSSPDAAETVKTQADIDMGRLVSGMSTVHYLAWAIPALGFIGTVRGMGMGLAGGDLKQAIDHLLFAFDATLVSLLLSLPLMFFIHNLQRSEEAVVLDAQQYCLEHLVARLYDVEKEPSVADGRYSGGPAHT